MVIPIKQKRVDASEEIFNSDQTDLKVFGPRNVIKGDRCSSFGDGCILYGNDCEINGDGCTSYGQRVSIVGNNNKFVHAVSVMGRNNKKIIVNDTAPIPTIAQSSLHVLGQTSIRDFLPDANKLKQKNTFTFGEYTYEISGEHSQSLIDEGVVITFGNSEGTVKINSKKMCYFGMSRQNIILTSSGMMSDAEYVEENIELSQDRSNNNNDTSSSQKRKEREEAVEAPFILPIEENDDECKICFTNACDTDLNCGNFHSVCGDCAEQMSKKAKNERVQFLCPICRGVVRGYEKNRNN
jgi:hypothetical protein